MAILYTTHASYIYAACGRLLLKFYVKQATIHVWLRFWLNTLWESHNKIQFCVYVMLSISFTTIIGQCELVKLTILSNKIMIQFESKLILKAQLVKDSREGQRGGSQSWEMKVACMWEEINGHES